MKTPPVVQIEPLSLTQVAILNRKQANEISLDTVLKRIEEIKDPVVTSDYVRDLASYMQGGTFFIDEILYSGMKVYFKSHINPLLINNDEYKGLKDYIDLIEFEVDRESWPPRNYPSEKLGNNIALRWFDSSGRTSVLNPVQIAELIEKLLRMNPNLAHNFVNKMMYQAFYGTEKTKSY